MDILENVKKDKDQSKEGVSAPLGQGTYITDPISNALHKTILESTPGGRKVLEIQAFEKDATKELSQTDLDRILGTTVKHDSANKKITFLSNTLTYTAQDQQNLAFNGPSASGKSHISLEVVEYFPNEDVIKLGYTSPTAFFHSQSRLETLNGEMLQPKNQYVQEALTKWESKNPQPAKGDGISDWREKRRSERYRVGNEWENIEKRWVIDLRKKILLFLDQPNDILLRNLRPLLSHDESKILIKITDKTKDGGNRTKEILLIGYPTFIFNSARYLGDEQERTRFWLLSPELSQEKIRDTLKHQSVVIANRQVHQNKLNEDHERQLLKRRLQLIKERGIEQILVREDDRKYLVENFLSEHPELAPRHQRDLPRIFAMVKAHALLNCFSRELAENGRDIWANRRDIDEALTLVKDLVMSNELGLPPYIYDFWVKHLKPKLENEGGVSRRELAQFYHSTLKHRLGEKATRALVAVLEDAGLATEEPDPDDHRLKKIYVLLDGGETISPPQGTLVDDVETLVKILGRLELEMEGSVQQGWLVRPLIRESGWTQRRIDEALRAAIVWKKIISSMPGFYRVKSETDMPEGGTHP